MIQYKNIDLAIDVALSEDSNDRVSGAFLGDRSSLSVFTEIQTGHAKLLVKDEGVIAGVDLAKRIIHKLDSNAEVVTFFKDGDKVKHGDIIFTVTGSILALLKAERVLLNFMQRMSGIATLSHLFAEAVKHTNCKILDTRKTTPGLREIEKWAVRIGGAYNHRFGLYDMIMLKDNHVDYSGGIKNAIHKANAYKSKNNLDIPVEIETRNLKEVEEVLSCGGIQRIMLDNFTVKECSQAVLLINNIYETEASGGINLQTVVEYAETGVQFISVGGLTHSAKCLDISFKARI